MSPALLLALSLTVAAPAPELIVDVDFNDEVMIRPEPITEAEVERLAERLTAAGFEAVDRFETGEAALEAAAAGDGSGARRAAAALDPRAERRAIALADAAGMTARATERHQGAARAKVDSARASRPQGQGARACG